VQVFSDERLTAALLDRLTHDAHRYYDNEVGYYSVFKVQGGRFFDIKINLDQAQVVDFLMLKWVIFLD